MSGGRQPKILSFMEIFCNILPIFCRIYVNFYVTSMLIIKSHLWQFFVASMSILLLYLCQFHVTSMLILIFTSMSIFTGLDLCYFMLKYLCFLYCICLSFIFKSN